MFEVSSLLLTTGSLLLIVVAAAAVVVLLAAAVGFASWFCWRLSARVMRGLAPATPDFGDPFPCCTPPIVLAGAYLMAVDAFSFCAISLF